MQLNDRALSHKRIKEHLEDGKKFDIVMVNAFLASEAGYYLAKKLDASIVIYSTGQVAIPWVDAALGQPHNPSYMPNPLLESSMEMSFRERLISFVTNAMLQYGFRDFYVLGKVDKLLDKHFPGEIRPSLIELERNATLALAFSHPLIQDGWHPVNPNYVHLGMMNCR